MTEAELALERGDVVIAALPGEHGKPRPFIVVQATRFAGGSTVAVVPTTSHRSDAPLIRVDLESDAETGLKAPSQAMINLIVTAHVRRIDRKIGRLDDDVMLEISSKLAVFLGIAT